MALLRDRLVVQPQCFVGHRSRVGCRRIVGSGPRAQGQLTPKHPSRGHERGRDPGRQLVVSAQRPLVALPGIGQQEDAGAGQSNGLVPTGAFRERRPTRRDQIELDGITAAPAGRSPDRHPAREMNAAEGSGQCGVHERSTQK
jgi:hypothetical protein